MSDGRERFGVLELWITHEEFLLVAVITLAGDLGAQMRFVTLSVVNDCYPMQPPPSHLRAQDLITVAVRDGATLVQGVAPA